MKNHRAWIIAVVAGLFVPAMIWAASQQFGTLSPTTIINCAVAGACNITVSANGAVAMTGTAPAAPAGGVVAAPEPEKKFGAINTTRTDQTTNWTGGNFSGDLLVDGWLTASSSVMSSSSAQNVADYATFHASSTMQNATTTCSFQNTSGRTRTIIAIGATFSSSTYNASAPFTFVMGTSTNAYVTSTSPFVWTSVSTTNGADVITTTSTMNTTSTFSILTPTYAPWPNNQWITAKSGTTTDVGVCRVLSY